MVRYRVGDIDFLLVCSFTVRTYICCYTKNFVLIILFVLFACFCMEQRCWFCLVCSLLFAMTSTQQGSAVFAEFWGIEMGREKVKGGRNESQQATVASLISV